MTGGYRYGAGRPGWKRVSEQTRKLTVGYLSRRGFLNAGVRNLFRWHQGGEPVGSVVIAGHPGFIRIEFKFSNVDGVWVDRSILAGIAHEKCNFGGTRPWFQCPRCIRRCGVLYVTDTVACRHCMHVGYECQRENHVFRLSRKIQKLEDRLGWDEFREWIRPKGMHQRTYERLTAQVNRLEHAEDWAAAMRWGALLERR